jgi:hypothetical protein
MPEGDDPYASINPPLITFVHNLTINQPIFQKVYFMGTFESNSAAMSGQAQTAFTQASQTPTQIADRFINLDRPLTQADTVGIDQNGMNAVFQALVDKRNDQIKQGTATPATDEKINDAFERMRNANNAGLFHTTPQANETPAQTADRLMTIGNGKWTPADTANLKTDDAFYKVYDALDKKADALPYDRADRPERDLIDQTAENLRTVQLQSPQSAATPTVSASKAAGYGN